MVADTTSLPLFILSVFAISLTGAMMPGPVTALTIAKGSQNKNAGAFIALGHGLIELPVILLIYFGIAPFLESDITRISIGTLGGAVLIWMGISLFKQNPSSSRESRGSAHNAILSGLSLTAANPYFFVWWATVGAALIVSSSDFADGSGVAAMGFTHWISDFAWLFLLSWIAYKSKRLWTDRVNRIVFGVCSAILAGFGCWFVASSIHLAIYR